MVTGVGNLSRLLAFAVTLALTGSARAGPPWATDDPSFQASYLQADDLPAPADKTGDWAHAGCDGVAARHGCTHSGKKLWTARDAAAPVWQVHDLRWVFPDVAAAQRYMQAGITELAEGLPPVFEPPRVGSDAQMFTARGDTYGLGVDMFMVNLIFRVDNVVVKLFVTQGPTLKGQVLTPVMVAALGQKAADHIHGAWPSQAPVAVAVAPIIPTPAPMQLATSEPTPARAPPSPRRRGRLGDDIKRYWRRGVDSPYIFLGGDYSRALGKFKLPGGTELHDKNGFDIALATLVHPRIYVQVMFHRDVWQVPHVEKIVVRRLEFIYGLDLLALPPQWRVRPALMVLLGFGFGSGRVDALTSSPPAPMPVEEVKAPGIGGLFGADFAVHIRVRKHVEIAPYAGLLLPAYRYTKDFLAGERHIDGERGFGRAWRWHAGLKIGFGGL